MEILRKNPFSTTKANDLKPNEINDQWVNIGSRGAFELFSPTSQKAIYIQGGKGSGKTHLMRYFSHSAQLLRNDDVLTGIRNDGYFGVYFQASALQGSRVYDLRLSEAGQEAVSIYSFDLYLSTLFLSALNDIKNLDSHLFDDERAFCMSVASIFEPETASKFDGETIEELLVFFENLNKQLDLEINNSYFGNEFRGGILAARSQLVFQIPALASKLSQPLKSVTFLYMADELENINVHQQKYINTLVREKIPPVTFRLGARIHGDLTYDTLGSGEANKDGHEFESLILDNIYLSENHYETFAVDLIVKRLVIAGLVPSNIPTTSDISETAKIARKKYLEDLFETFDLDNEILGRNDKHETSFNLKSFKSRLERSGSLDENVIDIIVKNLGNQENLLLETAGLHLFSQKWFQNKSATAYDLVRYSEHIKHIHESDSPFDNSEIKRKLGYFKNNYIALILKSKKQHNLDQYTGLKNLLSITKGVPRHILNLLGHIYKCEAFADRRPFESGSRASISSQHTALRKASDWFFGDSITDGVLGPELSIVLDRICETLRSEYYANKPVECSASGFDLQLSQLNENSQRIIKWAKKMRVIIQSDSDRSDKNSKRVNSKYYINGLLCPRWGLPIHRRGSLKLQSGEANAIFDFSNTDAFPVFINQFVSSRNIPFEVRTDETSSLEQTGFDF